jgi:hypothetical protein
MRKPQIFPQILILGLMSLNPLFGERIQKDTLTVTLDPTLSASGVYRFLFGDGYRDLWTTAIEAGWLDLRSHAGGLTPTGTGKGMQSLGLRFIGKDGRPYTFRPIKKTLLEILPEYMHDTFFESIVEDQLKSAFPTAPLVVPVMLDALEVLHATPMICIIPDDPLLGEYRELFAGKMGMIEEWPNEGIDNTPGFAGATEIHSTEELRQVLKNDPCQRVDTQKFLIARLFDLLIGDWDRHSGQWRWANVGQGTPKSWVPIPEDRDQAFAKYDGLLIDLMRQVAPQLTKFGPDFNPILGMTWNGRTVDRQFLVDLSRSDWDRAIRLVQTRLDDSVIDAAMQRLPQSHYELAAQETADTLKIRREKLPKIAEKFYRHLAGEVDIAGTDKSELVEVVRLAGGRLDISITEIGNHNGSAAPYFQRRFDPAETKDIRLYLNGGDDRVEIEGPGPDKIRLRIISSEGADQAIDLSRSKGTKAYDSRPRPGLKAQGIKVDRRPYTPLRASGPILPTRDWGKMNLWSGELNANGDVGFLMGVGFSQKHFGFRRDPFATRWSAAVSYATELQSGRISTNFDRTWENSKFSGSLEMVLSGIETLNFFGFGNKTSAPKDKKVAKAQRNIFRIEPALRYSPAPNIYFQTGIALEHSNNEERLDSILLNTAPPGTRDYWLGGVVGRLVWDTLDSHGWPTRGFYFRLHGDAYPDVFKNEDGSSFWSFEGILGGVVPITPGLVMAGKIGGRHVWGTYPYYHAAYLGGSSTLRGFDWQRFAGDASAYGSLELRFPVSRYFVILPGEFGLFGFMDVGRVFLAGESSDTWHTGYGGGIWIAPLIRQLALRFSVAGSDEGTRVYFGFGFDF